MAIIELQEPFKSKWKKGYLRYSTSDNRGRIDLYNSKVDRTTISYARYLKSVELGYEVPEGYEVDHKNQNTLDDSNDNLQILTEEEHRRKTSRENGTGLTIVTLTCGHCQSIFERPAVRVNKSNKKYYCSLKCSGKDKKNFGVPLTQDEKDQIKSLKGKMSSVEIAKIIGRSDAAIRNFFREIE